MASRARADTVIRTLLGERGAGKTICPSEVARALAAAAGSDDWRPLLDRAREAALKMVARGEVVIMQKGKVVDGRTARGPIRIAAVTGSQSSYAHAYRGIDFRKHPELYRVGRGEEGVLIAEPYKSELLPLWRFKTPEIAKASVAALWKAFVAYRKARDLVGMDMARKYFQMGFTRARRYANHRSGRKYDAPGGRERRATPDDPDPVKAASASIFYEAWQRAERDRPYRAWREEQRHRPPPAGSRPEPQ